MVQIPGMIRMNGTSMSPYLKEGDLLWVEPLPDRIPLGAITQVSLGDERDDEVPTTHRCIQTPLPRVKGDRVKRADHILYDQVLLKGIITCRLIKKKNSAEFLRVSYDHPMIRLIHSLQARLSQVNDHRFWVVHRLFQFSLILLGLFARKLENNFMARQYSPQGSVK